VLLGTSKLKSKPGLICFIVFLSSDRKMPDIPKSQDPSIMLCGVICEKVEIFRM
jgi:hypothetical protein